MKNAQELYEDQLTRQGYKQLQYVEYSDFPEDQGYVGTKRGLRTYTFGDSAKLVWICISYLNECWIGERAGQFLYHYQIPEDQL